MKRKIAAFLLIAGCMGLGGTAFMRLQANIPREPPGGLMPSRDVRDIMPADDALRDPVIETVMDQLNAFRRNDYRSALTFESHLLGNSLGSPQDFRQQMMSSCPEIAYYKSVQFGRVLTDAAQERVYVFARVTGADEVTVRAFYFLVRDDDGSYRVYGIRESRFGGMDFDPVGPR